MLLRLGLTATLLSSVGCARVAKGIDTVCTKVELADRLTAKALLVAPEEGVTDHFIDRYLVPIGEVILEAHDWCFTDPEN